MKKSTKFFGCVTAMFIMLLMLSACTNNKPRSTSETTITAVSTEDTAISTTVDTTQETTRATTKRTTKAFNRCQYKENGQQNCQNEATHGELCDKHFNYLNDIYNGLFN